MDFKKLALECLNSDKNENEAILKYIDNFLALKDYYIIGIKVEGQEFCSPYAGVVDNIPYFFIFSDEDFAKEAIENKIKEEVPTEKVILKYPIESLVDYIEYLKRVNIDRLCINFGEYALFIDNTNFIIQYYQMKVGKNKVEMPVGTKLKIKASEEISLLKEEILKHKDNYPEIIKINLCEAIINEEHKEGIKSFLIIPSFDKEYSNFEVEEILKKLNSSLISFIQKNYKDYTLSFYHDLSLIPDEILEYTQIIIKQEEV